MRWLLRYAKVLLAIYSLLLALVLFSPQSGLQSSMVYWLVVRLWHLGLSDSLVTYPRLEVVMNAAIVAPLTFLASVVWRRFSWRDWTAFGFVLSSFVETTQLLLLPDRQASFSDVVANTAGACVGALVFLWVRLRWRSSRALRVSRSAEPRV